VIPVLFDRDWVHPWRRPAEERRSVRLSAPLKPDPLPDPVYDFKPLDYVKSRYCGWIPARVDALVFGADDAHELQGLKLAIHEDMPTGDCWRCRVKWRGNAACWYCGPRP
jgi:hypothetical protein